MIENAIATGSAAFQVNRDGMLAQIARMRALEERARAASAAAKDRFHKRGQLLPRERVALVLDPGSPFLELSTLTGYMFDIPDPEKSVPGGGVIAGIGFVSGVRCMVSANDSGIDAGALQPFGLDKTLQVQELALENKLPYVQLVESAGANLLRYRVEDFVRGGNIFRNLARLSAAGLPVVTVTHGSSTAGGAYQTGLSDYIVMVRGRTRAFLAGPPLLKAATGEVATEEELGGAEMHTSISGLGDYLAEDDRDALRIARDIMANLEWDRPLRDEPSHPPPRHDPEELLGIMPMDHKRPVDMRQAIARFVDDSDFTEFGANYGPATVCGHARIEGQAIGIITNNGPLDVPGANKATHFIQACCQSRTPILYMNNTTGYMVGKAYEEAGMIKHGSKMIQAVTSATVPQITIYCGASFGAGNYGMCGRGFHPRFCFSWPNAKTAVMGGEQAAETMAIVTEAAAMRRGKPIEQERLDAMKAQIIGVFDGQMDVFSTSARVLDDGEIARRIMRTARRLGYGVVAVYSDADRDALHVREADEAVRIGEALPAQSYLRIEALIAAAKAGGADAVHPGYGFLAENEEFAQACRDTGLVFIGPSPDAIKAMGNKAGAKAIMQVAGGGGRGMRQVADAAAFADALRSARSEAQGAFGDAAVILERAILEPRHIEIQVFGDAFGNAIHLGERDCSVQRRHQKLIEEAPSPKVTAELRARMGGVAVAAIKSIGYEGAGTLEFLLDRNGEFYFMEMNTRLQVEHPVTEAITGLDLVELQLRVAAGEPLGLRQDDIQFSGHAIEARLCSEDAAQNFMPQSGRMALWQMPDGLLVEHALQSGSEIPPFYDSMIAKIISHGATRDEARRRLICGLEHTVAFGVTTNQAFLAACLRHPAFASGEATTTFIAKYRGDLLAPRKDAASEAALAALLLYVTDANAPLWRSGRTLAATFPIPVRIELDHGIHDLEIVRGRAGGYVANIDGGACRFEIDVLGHYVIRFRANGVMESARFLRDRDRLYVLHRGVTLSVRDLTLAAPAAAAAASGGDGKVRAAMSGRVVAVLVKPGERVAAGQPVMTLEAMKMEHVHTAPLSGTISAIDVAEGVQLTTGKIVVEIEADAQSV